MSATGFHRTRMTWQAYLSIGYFSYLLNVLGPLTPFLRDELSLSYTVASLHFSAYAAGTVLTGLVVVGMMRRFGARATVWGGALGMSLGALLIVLGRHPALTIGGALLMGLMGIIIVAVFQGALAEEHGEQRVNALTESTALSSGTAALAPLAVGFFARTALTWRAALVLGMLMLAVLWLVFRKDGMPGAAPRQPDPGRIGEPSAREGEPLTSGPLTSEPLPFLFWLYWTLALLAVSIEFCIISWGADFLQKVVGLAQADAALGMGLFMGAMLIGRLINSRLVWKVPAATLVWLSLGLAGAGFGLFWMGPRMLAPAGLAVAGLGVSGLYPLFGSLALGACQGRIVEGSARFTLSSGLAILMLPLLLGRLADWFGIRLAYGLVAVLIGLSLALLGWAASAARQARKAESARLARLYPGDEAAERHAEV